MNRFPKRSILFLTFGVCMLINTAAAVLASTQYSRKILELTRFNEQLQMGYDICRHKAKTVDVETIRARNPSLFLSLEPSSQAWPEVREAFIRYTQDLCVPSSVSGYSTIAAEIYSKHLSGTELQQVHAFFESPTGKKYADASTEVTRQVNEAMASESVRVQQTAWKTYEAKMLELWSRRQ